MKNEHIRVLLVEDNPGDARLIQEMLREATSTPFELECADRLSSGLEHLTHEGIDVVLLDLGLPDSQGIDTLAKMRAEAPDIPVVVLTGLEDETLAVKAVQQGAQDYLGKGQLDNRLLVRSIRYAIERQRWEKEREREKEKEKEKEAMAERIQQLEQELQSLEGFAPSQRTAATAQAFGLKPLLQSFPSIFNQLVQHYGELMELALEQRAFRVEHDISGKLQSIAEELGFLHAGPRDVVEIHSSALKNKSGAVNQARSQAYIEEGRVMVLQLMGHLVSHYRTYAMGAAVVKGDSKPVREKMAVRGDK
jgi:DNA-binding response OmpR family regulator